LEVDRLVERVVAVSLPGMAALEVNRLVERDMAA
jgi:hypothetical protein